MATTPRRPVLSLLICITLFVGCADHSSGPTSPTAVQVPTPALSWECGRRSQSAAALEASGWSFSEAPASCPATPALAQEVGIGLVSVAPANLQPTITGTTVRLDWDEIPEAVTSFLVEAGSAPTLANLAILNTGSSATSLTVDNVPIGVYYVRVRAIGPDGLPGPASNEIIVRVGVACATPPGAPRNLTRVVTDNRVAFSWLVPATGDPPASYTLEAGSGPNLLDVLVFNTGNAEKTLSGLAPNGLYYVRLRAVNACGTSAASNEVIVGVNVPEPPTPDVLPPLPPGGGGGGPVPPPPPPGGEGTACSYSVTPSSVNVGSDASTFNVAVTTGTGCPWSASSSSPFVTVAAAGPGSGNGAATFSVSANASTAARMGTVRISFATGGSDTVVTQAAAPPLEGIISSIVEVGAPVSEPPTVVRGGRPDAGAGPVVSASADAGGAPNTTRVNVMSATPFDTVIVSASSFAVSEGYFLVVLENPTTHVTLTIATSSAGAFSGQFAAALGSGPIGNYASVPVVPTPCSYAVSPMSVNVVGAGGTFVVDVTTAAGCPWTASSLSPFIIVHGFPNFTGSGNVTFVVNANTATAARSGLVRISRPGSVSDVSVSQAAGTSATAGSR